MFCFYNQMIYLVVSGSLRMASILRLSEEAGIQRLGSDSEAIWKVRLFSSSIAGLISLVLAGNKSTFQMLFDPEALPGSVSHLDQSKLLLTSSPRKVVIMPFEIMICFPIFDPNDAGIDGQMVAPELYPS